jgi:hypothetical protein
MNGPRALLAVVIAASAFAGAPPPRPKPTRAVFFLERSFERELAYPIACVRADSTIVAGNECLSAWPAGAALGGDRLGAAPALGPRVSTNEWCGGAPADDASTTVTAFRVARAKPATRHPGVASVAVWPAKAGAGLATLTAVDNPDARLRAELEQVSQATKVPVERLHVDEALEFDADGDGVPDRWVLVTEPSSGKWVGPKRIHHWTWLFTSRSGAHQIPSMTLVGALDLDGDGQLELLTLDTYQWGVVRVDGTRVLSGPACDGEG